MKQTLVGLFLAMLVANADASWPSMKLDPAEVAREPARILALVFDFKKDVYISGPDFRKATIALDGDAKEFRCRFPISYVEDVDWLALNHDDRPGPGWTSLPNGVGSEKWKECEELTRLLAALDQAGIAFDRTTAVRRESKTDRFLAAWNYLEFGIPVGKKESIFPFLKLYLSGYQPGTEIQVYKDDT